MKAIQEELGVSPAEVCAAAKVSIGTLYNVYANRKVHEKSVSRIRKALDALGGKPRSSARAG